MNCSSRKRSCEDSNYEKEEQSDKTGAASSEDCNEQEENYHISKHVEESNQKLTPTLKRSNRIGKPMI